MHYDSLEQAVTTSTQLITWENFCVALRLSIIFLEDDQLHQES
jgi:hypothetical protein